MDIIEKNVYYDKNIDLGLIKENSLFFDIETTGLDSNNSFIYLIGALFFVNGGWISKQYFANDANEEKTLLESFYCSLSKDITIFTYNGDSFDIPFTNIRLYKYNLASIANPSFDYYKLLKSNKHFLDLKNLKLKTVQEFLSIPRKDKLNGRECIELYNNFLLNKSTESKELLIHHNFEDIYALPLFEQLHDILKTNKTITLSNLNKLIIKNIRLDKDFITIKSYFKSSLMRLSINERLYSMDENNAHLTIKVEVNFARIDKNTIGAYIKQQDFILENMLIDEEYNISNGILVLFENNKPILSNIKRFVKLLVEKHQI